MPRAVTIRAGPVTGKGRMGIDGLMDSWIAAEGAEEDTNPENDQDRNGRVHRPGKPINR